VAADAGFPMGFQSIFTWEALPEVAFVKRVVIDAQRSKHESIASGSFPRSARPILPQASPVWKVWNFPDCFPRARESVRRASGFVQVGFWGATQTGCVFSKPLSNNIGKLEFHYERYRLQNHFGFAQGTPSCLNTGSRVIFSPCARGFGIWAPRPFNSSS
jgi:hypothetical protein